ncbi:MAG: 6-bladed beta-propeller [Longimicrobiales bacterium]|nr:6-bladed beta-propeller [Longimicrobiales bacterium]
MRIQPVQQRRLRGGRPILAVFAVLAPLLAVAACDGEPGGSSKLPDVSDVVLPVFAPSDTTLAVGRVSGDDVYLFEVIRGVRWLPQGGVVVADGGRGRISLYDGEGGFRHAFGREGEGPGEFGALAGLWVAGPDSILALDQRRDRVSRFHLDGSFERQLPAHELSDDTVFTMDVRPHRRFLVRGALLPDEQTRVAATLAEVPLPYGTFASRAAWWPGDGSLWIRESGSEGPSDWLVLTEEGAPERWIRLPAGFEPLDLRGDEVAGRLLGAMDVETVRAYRLAPTGGRESLPAWWALPHALPDSAAIDQDAFRSEVVGSIKFLASSQEIHYARNSTYSTRIEDIVESPEEDLPEGMTVEILTATSRGWAMVAAHPDLPVLCTLGYGSGTPAGWRPGSVRCGG